MARQLRQTLCVLTLSIGSAACRPHQQPGKPTAQPTKSTAQPATTSASQPAAKPAPPALPSAGVAAAANQLLEHLGDSRVNALEAKKRCAADVYHWRFHPVDQDVGRIEVTDAEMGRHAQRPAAPFAVDIALTDNVATVWLAEEGPALSAADAIERRKQFGHIDEAVGSLPEMAQTCRDLKADNNAQGCVLSMFPPTPQCTPDRTTAEPWDDCLWLVRVGSLHGDNASSHLINLHVDEKQRQVIGVDTMQGPISLNDWRARDAYTAKLWALAKNLTTRYCKTLPKSERSCLGLVGPVDVDCSFDPAANQCEYLFNVEGRKAGEEWELFLGGAPPVVKRILDPNGQPITKRQWERRR